MQKSVFFIPHKENYILYAPLKGIISLINKKAADELRQSQLNEKKIIKKHVHAQRQNSSDSFANITFILTSNCTMSCIYCYANGGKSNKTLPWSTFTKIVDFVILKNKNNKHQTTNISFHGGDISAVWSLFKKSIDYIEDNFRKEGLPFNISTGINGVLTKPRMEFISKHTSNATVSIDGFSEIQNLNRPLTNGNPSFKKVDNTLKFFDANNYNYGIRTTVTSQSVQKLDKIVAYFCQNYAAKTIMVEPMFPLGRGFNVEAPTAEEFVHNFRKANQIAKLHGRELAYSGARLNSTTSIFCKALEDSVVITPEGLVSSCYEIVDRESPVSEYFIHGYFDTNSNKIIFDNQKQTNLLETVEKENEKCSDCFCKYNCAGDCPIKAISMKLNNTKNIIDRCYINQELTKDQLLEALDEKL